MFITPADRRPAISPDTLRSTGTVEAPLVALFDTAEAATAAIQVTGAQVLRHASHGVLTLAPTLGLRERLYAAGAMLVVG